MGCCVMDCCDDGFAIFDAGYAYEPRDIDDGYTSESRVIEVVLGDVDGGIRCKSAPHLPGLAAEEEGGYRVGGIAGGAGGAAAPGLAD